MNSTEKSQSSYVIENAVPLSKSVLWKMEKNAYAEFGPSAWTKHGVPFYITANPLICKQYAAVVLGYLQDCSRSSLSAADPFYIIELGAGIGRFGYLFIKELCALLESLGKSCKELKFCYVLTDISQKNIDFWTAHPALKKYIQEGVLDFSLYDPLEDVSITLMKTGKVLSNQTIKNPLTVIANYFFDSIPQDLFRIKDGKIEKGFVSLSSKTPPDDLSNPEFIKEVMAEYTWCLIQNPGDDYSSNPRLNKVLHMYSAKLEQAEFFIPAAGIRCIDNLLKLSEGRMLLLTGDKGVSTLDEVMRDSQIMPVHHATFSFQVNFHALSAYYTEQANAILLPIDSSTTFMVAAVIFGSGEFSHTSSALSSLNSFTPLMYWELINQINTDCPAPSLHLILNLLKLGNWDLSLWQTFLAPLQASVQSVSDEQKGQLEKAIDLSWNNYYQTSPNEGVLIQHLGSLLFEMKRYAKALLYYKRAYEICPTDEQVLFNMSLCYQKMGQFTIPK